MTTRRRALVRAGVVMLLAMGVLAVGSPAFAGTVGVTVDSQFTPFNPGDTQLLKVTVSNTGAPSVTVSVSGLSNFTAANPQGCDSGGGSSCTISFGAGDTSKDVSFSLTATGHVDAGQSKADHGRVTARQDVLLGGNAATAVFDVTVKGPPAQTASVSSVSGVVRDMATGSPLKDALVVVMDSGACGRGKDPCQTGTDNNGAFRFASGLGKPITPGTIQIGATKNGYDNASTPVDARAGQSVNVSLKLKPTVAASSSAPAEALPSAAGQQPTADAAAPTAAAVVPKPAGNSGLSIVSWIVLVLAGLLVLLGVGVFAMMLSNRRKGDADESANEDADGVTPSSPGGAAVGAGSGVYGGAAAGADPTMVADPAMTSAMGSPGAADATAVIGPQRAGDEFPDPHAAAYPVSPAGHPHAGNGYGADPYATQVGGYGVGQPAGYGPATQVGGGVPAAHGPGGMHGGEYGNNEYGNNEYGNNEYGNNEYGNNEYGTGYGVGAGYGGPAVGHSPAGGCGPDQSEGSDHSDGSGGGSPRYDEATRHWDGGADGGDTGGGYSGRGNHSRQHGGTEAGHGQQRDGYGQQPYGGYDLWAGHDQGYPQEQGDPQDQHGGGYDPYQHHPYQQERPTEAPTSQGGPRAGHSGDRRGRGWFDG